MSTSGFSSPKLSPIYLAELKQFYSIECGLELIELFKEKEVLVIGNIIVDEYIFCQLIGIANKSSPY